MSLPDNWRKSSHSGAGDGNSCVEIASSSAHASIRDSKDTTAGVLIFPRRPFTTFIEALKTSPLNIDRRA